VRSDSLARKLRIAFDKPAPLGGDNWTASPLVPLEILYRAFVSLCGRSAFKGPEVFPLAGLGIGLARIEAELSRREFSNHRCSLTGIPVRRAGVCPGIDRLPNALVPEG
jgi:hypothetical protein